MASDEKCADCGSPKVEYVIRGGICENCWIDWWVSGMTSMDAREKAAYRREIKADLRKQKKRKAQATKHKAG